jgi:glutamate--cysteine ligase
LANLYDIVALEIGKDEYIWPASMPCLIDETTPIPVAHFNENEEGCEAEAYRQMLLQKYGGKKQLLSGIHYNFSFPEKMIQSLYALEKRTESYKDFKNQLYLKVARNYLRYRWLIVYFLGCSPLCHETYTTEEPLTLLGERTYTLLEGVSYRNSARGYANQVDLFPSYKNVAAYQESLNTFITNGLISSPKELYSQVRLKTKDPKNYMQALAKDGIQYLEYRSIDINPFDKAGIKLKDLEFLNIFNFYLLLKEETDFADWQQEALDNQHRIADSGLANVMLSHDGVAKPKVIWGSEILREMRAIAQVLELRQGMTGLTELEEKLRDANRTYAYRMKCFVENMSYVEAHMYWAIEYKKEAYVKRFRLQGYEGMELSTQILMREAIKQGIAVEVLDKKDNFIALTKGDHTEYVKQATKTSKDTYITVLAMENKVVTKCLLEKAGLQVPQGDYATDEKQGKKLLYHWVGKPVVIKPKSTNFGLGISIFPKGAAYADLEKALAIAFKEDETVLIETFIPGKEYRFLVVGDEVLGVLHRVPANVIGDGISTIQELVQKKNKDPLRGKGYRTPLETIRLDESAHLYLKQQHLTEKSVPEKDRCVYLRENSNISTGGDSIDYTDKVHETYKALAVAATKAMGATICGVDMMLVATDQPSEPYSIIEVNFNPAIHIHSFPYQGTERKIAAKLLKHLGF